jgi:hypothetical protein
LATAVTRPARLMGCNIHSMNLGAITSRAAEDPARRRSGLSEGDPGSQPVRPARTDAARLAEERQKEATDVAIAEYRRLSAPSLPATSRPTPVTREWGEGFLRAL